MRTHRNAKACAYIYVSFLAARRRSNDTSIQISKTRNDYSKARKKGVRQGLEVEGSISKDCHEFDL